MNSCGSTLIVDVYDVVPWQSPGGAASHDVNGAKLCWLAVCILAVVKPCLFFPTINLIYRRFADHMAKIHGEKGHWGE